MRNVGTVDILDLAAAHAEACREAATAAKKTIVGGNFKKKIWSDAMAVHPSQIPEAMEFNKKCGFASVTFDKHGRPDLGSAHQARKYAIAHGYRHYNF